MQPSRIEPSTLRTLPNFDDLSPDLRYQLLHRWQQRDWAITLMASVANLAMLATIAVPQLNAITEQAVAELWHGGTVTDQVGAGISTEIPADFVAPVQAGGTLAGYQVTSGYGPRDTSTLPAGASADHKGVDLGTPIGTKLYAPGNHRTKVRIHCWHDADGGGLVADIEPADVPALRFQALHLDDCRTGLINGSEPFATTGDSGIGAAHLDWRQRDRQSGQHQHPQQHYLLWALTGTAPQATLSDIDKLRNAVIDQESAEDPSIVNQDSGALGLGQVMPENLAPRDEQGREILQSGWDYEALGEDLTPDAFLADPNKQIAIINHHLSQLYDQQRQAGHGRDEAIRRTAAAWYSGDAGKVNDPTPQRWHGHSDKEYPSIEDYSEAVLQRVKELEK